MFAVYKPLTRRGGFEPPDPRRVTTLAGSHHKPLGHRRKIILVPNQTPDRNERIYQDLKF